MEKMITSVVNPATEEPDWERFTTHDQSNLEMFADLAREEQKEWTKTTLKERLKLFKKLKRYIQKNHQRLVETIQSETGKTWPDAMVDVISAVAEINYLEKKGEECVQEKISPHWLLSNKEVLVPLRPRPLVGVISPWNLPLAIPAADIFPAIFAGNAVLWKPSEWTPLTALRLKEFMVAVGFPEHLLQVLIGKGDLGEHLCKVADYISFTGSCETGKKVKLTCDNYEILCNLEMGGKAPAIVLADADIERTASALVYGGISNLGQYCKSFERVYVQEEIFYEVMGKTIGKILQLQPEKDYGPFITKFQREKVELQIEDAKAKCAKVLTGGTRINGKGYWFLPTVIDDADHTMKVMKEETFGPVLPFMPFDRVEEAIELANDSHLGLNASVFTQNKGLFFEVAAQLEVGNVVGNDAMINWFVPGAPQCGVKNSTLQTSGQHRHGKTGVQRFGELETIVWHKHPFFHLLFLKDKELWWMPYGKFTEPVLKFFLNAF